jgi:hypothetical protein
MSISYVLPSHLRDALLDWCAMPLEIYQSLSIGHQQQVYIMWFEQTPLGTRLCGEQS